MISIFRALNVVAVVACAASFSGAKAATFTDGYVSLTDINSGNAFLDLSDASHITTTGTFTDYFDFGVTGLVGNSVNSMILATITQNQFFTQKNITGLTLVGVDSVSFGLGGPVYSQIATFSGGVASANLQSGAEYAVVVSGDAVGTRGGQYSGSGSISAVPIPGALPLFGSALIAVTAFAARRRVVKAL